MKANLYKSNLILKLDASDIKGLADGDAVAVWEDSSKTGGVLVRIWKYILRWITLKPLWQRWFK